MQNSWKEKEQEWVEKYNQGWSCAKIAREYKTFHGVVVYRLKKLGIPIRYRFSYYQDKHGLWKGVGKISGRYWSILINSASLRQIPFEITKEYIWDLYLKQEEKCAISGLKLELFSTRKDIHKNTGSLDRIDSSKGYIEGNVQWVHKRINIMKNNMTDEEFINWCHTISDYQRSKTKDIPTQLAI